METKATWLTRWQRVQQMSQYFWKRWTSDYLNQLQMRTKWTKINDAPKINDLVLIKDENLPPTQWLTGRITATFPGDDGFIRVVNVRTKNGEFKRPIAKICALPEKITDFSNFPNIQKQLSQKETTQEETDKRSEIRANLTRTKARIFKHKPVNILPIITALLAICTTISHQAPLNNKPYEITQFNSAPGLYFEKTHDVYMTHSSWNVLSYLNLDNLKNEFETFRMNLTTAKEFCWRKALPNGGCKHIVSHLSRRLDTLESRNTLIFNEHRPRRSVPTLHFIGDIFGDLFGTLGSKFEAKYGNDLSSLVKNDEHLLLLLKNHTSILESTLNLVKHDELNLQKQIEHVNTLADTFKNHSNEIENEEKLHNYFTYLTQVINEYDRQQAAIIQVITNSKRNYISHELFTPAQVERQVEIITQQVGTEFQIPTGIEIYSVSKISVYKINNQYIFKISIPLLKAQMYKLYEISRIPMINDNDFLWIENNEKYLLTSLDRKFYQFLDNFDGCIPYMNKQALICEKPTHWFTSNKEDCVWEIFNHIPRTACKIVRKQASLFVTALSQNQFIFVVKDQAKVTIICKDSVSHDWLRGEGLLALQPQCYLTGENIHLNTRHEFKNGSEIVIPNIDSIREWILESDKMNHFNLTANCFGWASEYH